MVARGESMFGCYDSYSYRLWSLANVFQTYNFPVSPTQPKVDEYFIKCPQCQKGYPGFQALKEHVEVAHSAPDTPPSPPSPATAIVGPGGFPCSQCSASFALRDQLEKHELLHSPNAQVSCKVCNKTFANVYRLQRHMISHDESAVLRKFKCPECEKAFKFKHHLKEHIRIHSGEKPFECANCGKRFSHSGSYSSHMTSKKCLVMNLKVGGRGGRGLLDKCSGTQRGGGKRGPMGSNSVIINNNNNNINNNNNAFPNILPKYGDFIPGGYTQTAPAPSLHPFYMAAAPTMHLPPYKLPSTLGHLLEHLTNSPPRQLPALPQPQQHVEDSRQDGDAEEEEVNVEKEDDEDERDNKDSPELEAVKRILETVNVSVTKQFLEANMQKLSSPNPSVSSEPSPIHAQEYNTMKSSSSPGNTPPHSQKQPLSPYAYSPGSSEGLAAKLEEAVTVKTEEMSLNGGFSGSEGITEDEDHFEDGRKVRVRSLIAEEQLSVLRNHYAINPRPKKEELAQIADKIKFPIRVVQVWFQNTRARDRREGRLIQVPYMTSLCCSPSPCDDQPLDLSTKKSSLTSTPASSPADSAEDALNLSRKSLPYTTSSCSSSSSPLPHENLSNGLTNGSRLARILAQPPHKTPNLGVVPIDRLVYTPDPRMSPHNMFNFHGLENGHGCSPSPGLDWRSWKQSQMDGSDTADEAEDSTSYNATYNIIHSDGLMEEDGLSPSKISKMSPTLNLSKSIQQPVDNDPEGQFICDQCEKAFSKQSSLARHKYEHSGQRPYKCDVCSKAFKHKHHLTEHKRLHSGEKPFQCSKCLKRFSHSGSYSQHMNHRYSYCKPYRE